jgi:XapX domain-containing protein
MDKYFIGLLIGFLIGAACRWFDIPPPAPARFIGALLVVAMTLGYIVTGQLPAP